MLGCFCIKFIHFMLKGKSLLEYINSFPPNEYKKMTNNVKIFSIIKKLFL